LINAIKELSFQTVFDAAADAMLLADGSGRIVWINDAAQRLLGYQKSELIGLALEMLVTPRYRKQYRYYQKLFLNKPARRALNAGIELIALN